MDGDESFEPEFMYTIMTQHFQIWYDFSILLSESMCIFAFGPSLSPSNFFPVLLIHSTFFCYVLLVVIFCSQIVLLPLNPIVGMSSCHLFLLAGRILLLL